MDGTIIFFARPNVWVATVTCCSVEKSVEYINKNSTEKRIRECWILLEGNYLGVLGYFCNIRLEITSQ